MTEAPFPCALRDYALLADGERGALVGPRGEIVWLCAPRWDSGSIFGSLIGGNGFFSVTPSERFVWGGYYETGSLIWHSRWVTDHGEIESREALAFPGDPERVVLLRRIRATSAPADVEIVLQPRAEYDRQRLEPATHHGGAWTARCGPLHLRLRCGTGGRQRDGEIHLTVRLEPGQTRDLVLELSTSPLDPEPADADRAWAATEASWRSEVTRPEGVLAVEQVHHSAAVLRGLTSRSGGMVAAATTSLPERADAGRNYDYRYVWIRDQCYAGQAGAALGGTPMLDRSVAFVGARLLDDGDRLVPAYTTSGQPVPDEQRLGLPGYPGGTDMVGNRVSDQFQLDAYGESLLLFAAAARLDRLDSAGARAAKVAADAVTRRWSEPDAGIWELEPHAWTHSRLIAAAGLRALAGADRTLGPAGDWLALADHIVADTAAHALHPDGRWQRAADDAALDAALLVPPLRAAVPAGDPRTERTFAAYLRELTVDGFAYRFRHDSRPLAEAEGSFLLCGFLVALSHQAHGDPISARAWFERTRAACSSTGLFSEEYDRRQRQLRGNLPQAFVHALMIETARRLADDNPPAPIS
ncbi:MAG: glycoside hydrolase family 15 protein [Actinobacteria bacterium]|nr:glycoside hydrolase family 15 protein [Actinomycetota bacterium]